MLQHGWNLIRFLCYMKKASPVRLYAVCILKHQIFRNVGNWNQEKMLYIPCSWPSLVYIKAAFLLYPMIPHMLLPSCCLTEGGTTVLHSDPQCISLLLLSLQANPANDLQMARDTLGIINASQHSMIFFSFYPQNPCTEMNSRAFGKQRRNVGRDWVKFPHMILQKSIWIWWSTLQRLKSDPTSLFGGLTKIWPQIGLY